MYQENSSESGPNINIPGGQLLVVNERWSEPLYYKSREYLFYALKGFLLSRASDNLFDAKSIPKSTYR